MYSSRYFIVKNDIKIDQKTFEKNILKLRPQTYIKIMTIYKDIIFVKNKKIILLLLNLLVIIRFFLVLFFSNNYISKKLKVKPLFLLVITNLRLFFIKI